MIRLALLILTAVEAGILDHYLCGDCHLPPAPDGGAPLAGNAICLDCHAAVAVPDSLGDELPEAGHVVREGADTSRAPLGGLLAGGPLACVSCHDPHDQGAAATPCMDCHPLAAETRTVGGWVRHPGGCLACHVVHASGNAFLLRWSRAREAVACLACHYIEVNNP